MKRFGLDTFRIIEEEWNFSEVKGISRQKAYKWELFHEQKRLRRVALFLQKYGISTYALKIYKQYGEATIDIIKTNLPFS